MPHHPSEENAPEGIYEKVAKDPSTKSESTASEDDGHKNEHNPINPASSSSGGPGPVIPDSELINSSFRSCLHIDDTVELPEAESKEDLQARAVELNK